MMTRRELLFGGTAGFAAAAIGRSAWAATPIGSGSAGAVEPAVIMAARPSPFDAIIGESPAIVRFRDSLRALLDRAADSRRPPFVVLEGETGTGKNLAAQVIHSAGPRRAGPFLSVAVTAIPDELLEAKLLGWARGALTYPPEQSGVWEDAHGGLVYLDQITELSSAIWPKVHRVVTTGSVRRLGDTYLRETDVWTIASSHHLDTVVGEQTRAERLAPLHPVIITVPPLRARGDDVQLLADHFLAETCRVCEQPLKVLTQAARDRLAGYPWPGNVRELSNVIECAVLLCEDREIGADDLPNQLGVAATSRSGEPHRPDASRAAEAPGRAFGVRPASGTPG